MAFSLVARLALLAKRRHAFREVRARPDPVAQLLLERLARARVLGEVALICCFTACTADGLLAAIRSAVSSAHGISRSAGTTRLTSPRRAASAASMSPPVSSSSMAWT